MSSNQGVFVSYIDDGGTLLCEICRHGRRHDRIGPVRLQDRKSRNEESSSCRETDGARDDLRVVERAGC